jgi:Ferritin-like
MSKLDATKLIPRNAPALRKSQENNPKVVSLLVGNPISTRLESGVGNCFPGLECDLRNLERRFFPFLEMDMPDAEIDVAAVDIEGAEAAAREGKLSKANLKGYRMLQAGGSWTVERITGTFGKLRRKTITVADLDVDRPTSFGPRRNPIDPWTAVRMLTEGTDVKLVLHKKHTKPSAAKVTLTGKRARYFGDDGALADIFAPGELTQSLCSPWTHDFRDCGCYYWASNHPDIALPPAPAPSPTDPRWNRYVPWERRDRGLDEPPGPATMEGRRDPAIFGHYEINRRWQSLNFVIEGRERIHPYVQRPFTAKPLATEDELLTNLRYAAGVELAVVHEYLAAAYSLKPEQELAGQLRERVRATHAELMRIAIGEMRHLRAVNNVLAARIGKLNYKPALRVATKLPPVHPGQKPIPVQPGALTPAALKRFIDIESPSESVDGVYAPILATLNQGAKEDQIQAIRTVMAEGEDHYLTFTSMQEWLLPYDQREYLRAPNMLPPPASNESHRQLQTLYRVLLNTLYEAYSAGLQDGAEKLSEARKMMVTTIEDAADAIARQKFLVVFDVLTDPRFTPIGPPSS